MNARLRLFAVLSTVAMLTVACVEAEPPKPAVSGDLTKGNPTAAVDEAAEISADIPTPEPLGPEQALRLAAELAQVPAGCEILSTKNCLLPFPSDAHTVRDVTTGTDRRINLPPGQLANVGGKTLDPTEWNRNDGWSPSTPIVVFVPGLDPGRTALPSEGNVDFSVTAESATVIVDLDTGQLVPHWAEMDSRAPDADNRALILRPAASLIETHRFAVGLRKMVGSDGLPLEAPITFQAIRDNNITGDARVDERQREFNVVFPEMADAGVERKDLYLSWYFTVASSDTLASRLLLMRDDAFGRLAGQSPTFAVTGTSTDDLQPGVARVVSGTMEVPLYLEGDGGPGSRMRFSPLNDDPLAQGVTTANFTCTIPESAVNEGEAVPVVYGHGLLGSAREAASSHNQHTAAANNSVYCATDLIGMAESDVGNAVQILGDISQFPSLPDRLQQGMLNTLFLGRLMLHQDGLGSAPEFKTTAGANMMNTGEAYYDGNSQGAIIGGAITAVAQDWTKAALGVGGMNYSTLLNRSVDFDQYFVVMRQAYPDPLEQQILFGVVQMLWDRGETSGYVQHLTNRTYSLTPAKEVLMTVAFGDHQVPTITADNMARTLGVPIYQPALPEDVSPLIGSESQADYFYGLERILKFPFTGSALYYWYSGTLSPPPGNITPLMSAEYLADCGSSADEEDAACADPHGDPRRQRQVNAQKKAFFQADGAVTNVCRDQPCLATPKAELDY